MMLLIVSRSSPTNGPLNQKLDLLLVERSAVGAVIIRNLDPSAIATANSFNGVCTHERRHIIADRPFTNVELAGQVVIGLQILGPEDFHFHLLYLGGKPVINGYLYPNYRAARGISPFATL